MFKFFIHGNKIKGKIFLKDLKVVDFMKERIGIEHASHPPYEVGRRVFYPGDQCIKHKLLN